jgi:hypothetical protein
VHNRDSGVIRARHQGNNKCGVVENYQAPLRQKLIAAGVLSKDYIKEWHTSRGLMVA